MMHEVYISWGDIRRIVRKMRRSLVWYALGVGTFTFCLLIQKEPLYKAEASFFQSFGGVSPNIQLTRVLSSVGIAPSPDSIAASLMLSRTIMKMVVEELGLQLEVSEKKGVAALWDKVRDNISLELRLLIPDPHPFIFRKVVYGSLVPGHFFLHFTTPQNYRLLDKKRKCIKEGCVGEELLYGDLRFTLVETPPSVVLGRDYPLHVEPWTTVADRCIGSVDIVPSKLDRNILRLTYANRNPKRAVEFLNELMAAHGRYLEQENKEISEAQIAYLEKRQSELTGMLDETLAQQVAYLKANIGEHGFLNFSQEMELLATPGKEYREQLFNIDRDLQRFQRAKDLAGQIDRKGDDLFAISKQKKQVEREIKEVGLLLSCVREDQNMPGNLFLTKDPKGIVAILAEQLRAARMAVTEAKEEERTTCEKELSVRKSEFRRCLHELSSTLRLKKRALEENIAYKTVQEVSLVGLSPEETKAFYIKAHTELDQLRLDVRQLIFVRDRIQSPTFEITSLDVLLVDPVSQKLAQEASRLAEQLRDRKNRTVKELQRLEESLAIKKRFLAHHIEQTVELYKMRTQLLEDKIGTLQTGMIEVMRTEKTLIQNKLGDLRERMSLLPERWRMEHQLKLRTELSKSVMEGIAQMSESHNVGHHLYRVQSKPLDRAIAPAHPKPPRLLFFSILAAFVAVCCILGLKLCIQILKGMPVSLESLAAHKQHTLGSLSIYGDTPLAELGDKDLQTLRSAMAFLTASANMKVVALVGSEKTDYSRQLCELLFLRRCKVLLIDATFAQIIAPDEVPGLWQYLQGEMDEIPITSQGSYDFLPSGGTSRYAAELVNAPRFAEALQHLRARYDFILVKNRSGAIHAEAQALLSYADGVIVVAGEETLSDLHPYLVWNSSKKINSLAFAVQSYI